jgi:glycosyltransferase involved in cell wall biosynthesis
LVVYPPIDIKDFKSAKPKTKQIISVGRFFGYLRDKKQDLMIKVFKKIVDLKKAQGWSLHLVGGAQEGDSEYVNELKELAKGYPIEISPNLAFKDLKNEYAKSAIYWHAAGFGETDPEKMEHFGITTVEAMAAGCVPVVINLGGQKEIVKDGENGFLWDTPEDFERKTVDLINNPGKLEKISKSASGMVAKFSTERFIEDINNIILN